jgi:putative polyhydroxyalkanoate system protein
LLQRFTNREQATGDSDLKIKRQHSLGVEEARQRVDRVAEELGGKLGLTSEWEGEHLRVHGKGVSGRILVFDDSVEVHVHVGLAMMLLREPIRTAIESSIDEYIA